MTKPKRPGAKILTIDVETSPLESWTWGTWKQDVGVDQIKTEWTILSVAAKWLGSKKVYYADTGGRGAAHVRDDKVLMPLIWKLLDEANIVVAQNGVAFDVRKMNARLIEHGYGPPSDFKVIDTMLVARKQFAFTSQKLKWTSSHLTNSPKDEHKHFPGFQLWVECLKDTPKAWREMRKYNIRDIRATEEVYLRLRPWMDQHPSVTLYRDTDAHLCPRCGSDKLERHGIRVLAQGTYQRYHCTACGGMSRGKQLLRELPIRKKQLVA
jgi:RNase_H superfamily